MASVQKRTYRRGGRQWTAFVARVRTPAGEVSKSFKIDPGRAARGERSHSAVARDAAEAWIVMTEAEIQRGQFISKADGSTPFSVVVDRWRAASVDLKPKTLYGYESILKVHLMPRFRDVAVSEITKPRMRAAVAEMVDNGAGASTIRNVVRLMSTIMGMAVDDRLITENPCRNLKLPTPRRDEMLFLDVGQVERLADAIEGGYGPWVRFMAYSGLRFGEAAALRCGRFDSFRGRVEVVESIAEVNGVQIPGPTKTNNRRTVSIPRFVVDELVQMLGSRLGEPDALVFTSPTGMAMRNSGFAGRFFKPAVKAAGLDTALRIHDLRHTSVALAVQQGAHAQQIKERLGHSTITTTFDRYGHVLPSLDEALVDGLDAAREQHLRGLSGDQTGTDSVRRLS